MQVNLMIEGQENVSWDQWVAIAQACEDSGLDALFRSDHYGSVSSSDPSASLDAWTTLAALAARTTRLRLGTLVSPVTFRHPALLAKSAVTVDHVSGGRVEVGIGAGWNAPEHRSYGFAFPSDETRLQMLEEQIEIVHRQWTEESFSFSGRHYTVEGSHALPKPVQRPHPPLIVGGAGGRRSARLAARWADEYNTVSPTPADCTSRRAVLDGECERAGRDPATLPLSVMTRVVVGTTSADLLARARAQMPGGADAGDASGWMDRFADRWVTGTAEEVLDRLGRLADLGVVRVMLQHLQHEDVETIALLGRDVAAHLQDGSSAVARRNP